ncbi:Fe-S cluster assembly protein SufD [Microbacterium trichothecenolyticum]|uniref:Fe-S cluster assembly protein SufD n=1 Tax=Microbacterium trichothecenolyticum TaxID=69370 RepID=UPI0028627E2E|nr:Fe-S cluster assembly protein SufD [Microbacterium trichothecenolyticum]MDR7185913.1 Fe-S cluster assembly protein SufD [Microbacterium trichothecenolyticum]
MSPTTEAATVPGAKGHTDGAGAFVPVQTRSERPWSFDPTAFEAPTGREVNWKHTPVQRLQRLFTDAAGDAGAVSVAVTGPLAAAGLAVGAAPRGEVFQPEDLSAAVAWSRSAEALYVSVPAEAELDEPVVIEATGAGAELLAHGHIVIEASRHSRATVVLRHAGSAQFAQNVEIIVREGAHLELVTVQRWDDDAVHVSSHQARVERDATLRHVVVSFGGGIVRVNPSVELAGTGSRAELYGLSYSDSGQHLESQVYLHHKGAETSGDVLYKSALQGAAARTVWIGDVLIGPDAVGTDSYEANRNLVLTEGARAESIPNLEIETGDIRGAGHASATGRFDDEQLFYLQARGITEDEARRLVVLGFLAEIVQKIGVEDLEAELFAAIEEELAKEAGL